jgi:redox-sensitive bicupin YhaK (pirin superfamily)
MTAGAGIIHEEFHSKAFSQTGGSLEMVQLWVNLPAKDKMTEPSYQAILNEQIPSVALPNEAGQLRVIAGEFEGHQGPAQTFTAMNVWDLRLNQGAQLSLSLPEGWTSAVVVLHGTVQVNGETIARDAQMVVLDRAGQHIALEANSETSLLLLSGEPLNEPIVGYGPFVMNTTQEINQAFNDFNSGKFGKVA